jgi:hypothetical protein
MKQIKGNRKSFQPLNHTNATQINKIDISELSWEKGALY